MRLTAYAGVSAALAAAILLRAFHERPNFYSAAVYLAQSSACRMILLNLLLLTAYGVMRGLQKILYGPLRAIEREQLWDKAWYAVTETALAMTTFRDEVGAWFFVMFVSLLAGKVWGWLSEARVEALEQQPPANPRLFHIRLSISLVLSEVFDALMLRYCIQTLLEQPRPGMMVMFAFEFAVLAITSTSTAMKYLLYLQEKLIIRKQTKAKVEERRQETRLAREEAQRGVGDGAPAEATNQPTVPSPGEEEIDENEIDVPGWQEKGRWVLFLDLLTDMLKLLVYMCFFSILLMFHGIPIHIIRDVFLTTRSFLKRISDFLKYRNATKDMNARYPDATPEELGRDGTCIICREEMRPWQQPGNPGANGAADRQPNRALVDERQRPKKLPCGHILHFGCLRSWLERQQVCPTCRSSVLAPNVARGDNRHGAAPGAGLPGQQPGGAQAHLHQRPGARPNVRRARTFNLGPWRLAFAAGDERQVRDALQALREENQAEAVQAHATVPGHVHGTQVIPAAGASDSAGHVSGSLEEQIARIEEQFAREFNSLALAGEQLNIVRGLQQELERLRQPAAGATIVLPGQVGGSASQSSAGGYPSQLRTTIPQPFQNFQGHSNPPFQQQVLTANAQQTTYDSGHSDMPAGFTIPPGWTLLPLQPNSVEAGVENEQQQLHSGADEVLAQVPFRSMSHNDGMHQPHVTPGSVRNTAVSEPPTAAPIAASSRLSDSVPTSVPVQNGHTSGSLQEHVGPTPSAPNDESTIDIPNWGQSGQASQGSLVAPSGHDSRSPHEGSGSDGVPQQSANGNMVDVKGKGKAATIEDIRDEDEG